MAALDSADGSRMASARRVARGLIGRLSIEAGHEAAIVTFSGRALPMAPWTDDWRAIDAILDDISPYALRPTGSDWDAALRTTLDLSSNATPGTPPTTIVFLTDGEVGQQPSEETIDRLIRSGWRVAFVTFGDDRAPGDF